MTSSVTCRRNHGRGEKDGWWLRIDIDVEGGRVQRGKERGRGEGGKLSKRSKKRRRKVESRAGRG